MGAVAAVAMALTAMPAQAGHHHYYYNGYGPTYCNGGYYGGGYYGGATYYRTTTYYPGPAYYSQPVYYTRPRVVVPVPFVQIGFGG